jgi:sugar phosphate permease
LTTTLPDRKAHAFRSGLWSTLRRARKDRPADKRFGIALRWWIIGLITLGTILNYLARSTLSVAAPTLKSEFGIRPSSTAGSC